MHTTNTAVLKPTMRCRRARLPAPHGTAYLVCTLGVAVSLGVLAGCVEGTKSDDTAADVVADEESTDAEAAVERPEPVPPPSSLPDDEERPDPEPTPTSPSSDEGSESELELPGDRTPEPRNPEAAPQGERVAIRGIFIQFGEYWSPFHSCTSDSNVSSEPWAISTWGQAAEHFGAFWAEHPELLICTTPGGGPCHLYLEGEGVLGEPGATELLPPSSTGGDASRQAVFTELDVVELVPNADVCPEPLAQR